MINFLLITNVIFMFILALNQSFIRKCRLFTPLIIREQTFSLINLLSYKVRFMIIRNPKSLNIFIRLIRVDA